MKKKILLSMVLIIVLFLGSCSLFIDAMREIDKANQQEAPTPDPNQDYTGGTSSPPASGETPTPEPTDCPTAVPTEEPSSVPTEEPTAEPTALPTPNPFIMGINLNGNAVTIEDNDWLSQEDAEATGFSIYSNSIYSVDISWNPSTDSSTSHMLNTSVFKSKGDLELRQTLANGNYNVYFWIAENFSKDTHSMEVSLEGNEEDSDIGKLEKHEWAKYGPYNVTVHDGTLNMKFEPKDGTDAHISGLAIFAAND